MRFMFYAVILVVCCLLAGPLQASPCSDKAMSQEVNDKADGFSEEFEDLAEKWSDEGCGEPTRQGERICSQTAQAAADALKKLDEHLAASLPMYEQAIAKYEANHDHKMRKYMSRKLSSLKEYQEDIQKTELYSYLKQSKLIP